MAKSRSFKSKKELEKEGRTLGIELDRRHSKEDLIEELEAVEPKKVESVQIKSGLTGLVGTKTQGFVD